jgi:hypothetical protein
MKKNRFVSDQIAERDYDASEVMVINVTTKQEKRNEQGFFVNTYASRWLNGPMRAYYPIR